MSIVEEYDKRSLFPMLLKFYYHLHPLCQVENDFINNIDQYNNLNIFEMITTTNELVKKLVNWELLVFQRFQIDAKDIKCHLK